MTAGITCTERLGKWGFDFNWRAENVNSLAAFGLFFGFDVMDVAILFDCEFLVSEGAQRRFWCGPYDPDPVIAQIGAVKIGLSGDFPILGKFNCFVKPVDRTGAAYALDPLFTKLTGITDDTLTSNGETLAIALEMLDAFSETAKLWSWGKDEFNMVAISCYVANIKPVIPVTRFDNACKLLLKSGMPYDDVQKTRSHQLASYFDVEHPPLQTHNALDDALSIGYVAQHLLRAGSLRATDFK